MTDDNPYRAPRAALDDVPAPPVHARLYSPLQAGWGSFFGGPFAAIHMVRANYIALGRHADAQRALVRGLAVLVAVLLLVMLLPGKAGSTIYAALGIGANRIVAQRQATKAAIEADPRLGFQSTWRVVGLVPIALILILLMALAFVAGLELLGYGHLIPD